MAEGSHHKRLVEVMASHIRESRSRSWFFFLDAAKSKQDRDGLPPHLANVRPDLYAREDISRHLVIGEAKSTFDIENPHTEKQLQAYFEHLSEQVSGTLVLTVPYPCAGTMYSFCKAIRNASRYSVPFTVLGVYMNDSSFVFKESWDAN